VRRPVLAVAILALAPPVLADAEPPTSVTLEVARPSIVFGDRIALRGQVTPAAAGVRVQLMRQGKVLARARTNAHGRYAVWMRPARSGVWRARIAGANTWSAPVGITVAPVLRIVASTATAFVGAPIVVNAKPSTAGPVTLIVFRLGRPVAELHVPIGRRVVVPTDAIGLFALRAQLGPSVARARVTAGARTLSVGSTGPDVVALRARLAELHVHVPAPSATFGSELFDSVVAFQKARGLERTGAVDEATWRALAQNVVPTPRYRSHGVHIEVSKSRQILMIVRDGETVWYLPVSSGAGGITPVGRYRILWKALATTTWLGPAILYRTMTFHTHYAIHGFPSVPTYPASHGCVRVPIWLADWLYQQSPVGESVDVYE
jgi:L,D-transpeptidase catalytic domain/Putative peptidoglycan binding domain